MTAAIGRFDARLVFASEWERNVEAYCLRKAVAVAKNGTEHTHPDFVKQLRSSTDTASKFVRFAPDGVFLGRSGVVYWEAKRSQTLERDAYNTYLQYHATGLPLILFIQNPENGLPYWQRVELVRFVPSQEIVNQYRLDARHPVDADDWICPRLGSGRSGRGSGTPYRHIDFSSLKPITDWDTA